MRRFISTMSVPITLLAGLTGALFTVPAGALAQTIAVSIPLSGDAAELGKNFRTGVKLAAETLNVRHRLFIADDGCEEDLAAIAAEDIARQEPDIVIGALCNDAAKALGTRLQENGIPIIVAGARSVRLIKDREREQWNLWRLSPGDDYPVKTAAEAIRSLWTDTPYAIVDDGTIYGRSFSDLLRAEMDESGLSPQFSDSFRAAQSTQAGLLRRLQRSGVKAAFIASATTEDLFTIARNMQELEISLDIMVTEALGVLSYLEESERIPPGVKIIAIPDPAVSRIDEVLLDRNLEKEKQIFMGYAAMEIALQAQSSTNDETAQKLSTLNFDTVLGSVRFAADGSSSFNPYRLMQWDGSALVVKEEETLSQ